MLYFLSYIVYLCMHGEIQSNLFGGAGLDGLTVIQRVPSWCDCPACHWLVLCVWSDRVVDCVMSWRTACVCVGGSEVMLLPYVHDRVKRKKRKTPTKNKNLHTSMTCYLCFRIICYQSKRNKYQYLNLKSRAVLWRSCLKPGIWCLLVFVAQMGRLQWVAKNEHIILRIFWCVRITSCLWMLPFLDRWLAFIFKRTISFYPLLSPQCGVMTDGGR